MKLPVASPGALLVFTFSSLITGALAQSSITSSSQSSSGSVSQTASASASASASGNTTVASTNVTTSTSSTSNTSVSETTLTTTLTTYPTTTLSDSTPSPSTYTLTLTVATSDLGSVNASIANGTYTNGTVPSNETVWEEGDGWLPFNVNIDPAYGIGGGFLLLSGIPVAMLGGKIRWSALAISSGYALFLFTLVMILRFGVQVNLAPPSPNPPDKTLRGLYLLACLISSLVGAGIGIFFLSLTKYAVSAGGGFTFAWFLLATKSGGLVDTVLGRWFMIGAITVASFVASLPKWANDYMVMASTAWIGATAFVLGVDCFTTAGLKEFYVYNLGFHSLFPKLNNGKYPLTQTMMIELGILAAVVIIGCAVQLRVVNIITKRLKQIREEEEAKIEAEEISKAAEHFKNVGVDLAEWEEKHGSGSANAASNDSTKRKVQSDPASPVEPTSPFSDSMQAERPTAILPQLGFEDTHDTVSSNYSHDASSMLSLLPHDSKARPPSSLSLARLRTTSDVRGAYESVNPDTPTSGMFLGMEELKPEVLAGAADTGNKDDPLEEQLRLLEEVKKARESVRGSLERLRSSSGGSFQSQYIPSVASSAGTPTGMGLDERQRRYSSVSTKLFDGPSRNSTPVPILTAETIEQERPKSQWDSYLSERKIITPGSASPPNSASLSSNGNSGSGNGDRLSQYAMVPLSVANSIEARRERTTSMLERKVSDIGSSSGGGGHYPERSGTSEGGAHAPMMDHRQSGHGYDRPSGYGGERPTSTFRDYLDEGLPTRPRPTHQPHSSYSSSSRMIYGSAADIRPSSNATGTYRPRSAAPPPGPKAMSIEELAERHRKHLSRLQYPVTAKLRESEDIEEAKKKWERQKAKEKAEMRKREEGARAAVARASAGAGKGKDREEALKNADEWRRSVVLDQQQAGKSLEHKGGRKAEQRQSRIVN